MDIGEEKPKRVFGIEEEAPVDDGPGSWILSYGDMMTLLLCFFLLLVAMSSLNKQMFEEVSASMAKGMGKVEAKRPIENIVNEVKKIIKEENLEDKVSITYDAEGAKFNFPGEALFEIGSADLTAKIKPTLDKIAAAFINDPTGHYIIIEGHTDNIPMRSAKFPSNWELSSARSSSVIRYLISKGLDHNRCKAVGYADTQPSAPNMTKDGKSISANQAKNRRVVVKLSRNVKE